MSAQNQNLECRFCLEKLPTLDERLDHEMLEHDGVTTASATSTSTSIAPNIATGRKVPDNVEASDGKKKETLDSASAQQAPPSSVGSKRPLTSRASQGPTVIVKRTKQHGQPPTIVVVSGKVEDSSLGHSIPSSKECHENEANRVIRLDDYNEMPFATTSIMSFKCSFCVEVIMPEKAFGVHVRAHRKGESPLMACIVCATPAQSMDDLAYHTWKFHRIMWKCSLDYNAMVEATARQIKIKNAYGDKKPSKFLKAFENYQLSVAICTAGYLKENPGYDDDQSNNFSCSLCQLSYYYTRRDFLLHYEDKHGIKLVGFHEKKPESNVCKVESLSSFLVCPRCRAPFYTGESYAQHVIICSGEHDTKCGGNTVCEPLEWPTNTQ